MSAYSMPCALAPDAPSLPAAAPARTYFFVTGEAGSELFPRLLNPFAKLGLTPYRVHSSTEHGTGEEMSVELRFEGLSPETVETLAAKCRTVFGVRSVMTVAGN